ncbi:MAG TPA: glycosyltransferase [Terriglobales bacterium]
MYYVAPISGVVCLAIWIYLLIAHGMFWRVSSLRADVQPATELDGTIAVVIPARDEADVIGATVQSLLRQTCVRSIHIFVVDDHSSDGTSEAAREAARSCGRSEALDTIASTALPTGWTGKLWAVEQGVQQAMRLRPRFLLLTDADIQHSPDNVAKLVAIAEAGNYDLTSFMVKLHCQTVAERLLVPPFVFFFFLLYPPAWIRDPHRKIAGAAGGCMLIRPQALEQAGGMAAIRNQIIDDCALARAVKQSGGRVWLGVTPDAQSTRIYGTFGEIERMIARTAFNQLQHSAWLLLGALVGLAITYLLPLGLLLSGNRTLAVVGAVSWLLMSATFLSMVRFYSLNPAWALTLPFSACFYMLATIHSAFKFWSGRGGEWKGRAQDVASTD